MNYADPIKDAVTMPMVLSMYGYPTPHGRRIPCPLHNGVKPNFAYKDHFFKCYVCGETGDVISFVEKLYGLDFMDACRKLDTDFGLGLNVGGEIDREKQLEAEQIAAQRKRAERERRKRQQDALRAYHSALDEWVMLDTVRDLHAPETPYDDITDEYATAVKRIDYVAYLVDCAEIRLKEVNA